MASTQNNLLDPDVLSQLPNLTLKVQSIVSYLGSGQHRSTHHGSSIEFSEHKLYSPGDEPKWIDWKFYAKTDRYYIKQFENESHINAYLVIDSSASMGYKGVDNKGISKLEYASILVASLAYLLIRQQDYTGLVSYSGDRTDIIPAGKKPDHLTHIIEKLEGLSPTKGRTLADSLALVTEKIKKGGIIVVVSDFFEDEHHIIKSLRLLKQRRQKIFLIHLLHHSERIFPFVETMEMFDIEGDDKDRIMVEPSRVKEQYLKELDAYISWWKKESMIHAFEYYFVDTSKPVHLPLMDILFSGR